jgi:serine-type D-Ala-D-Ala carboxypeptidase/endopeptidase (penicillin-binding protein 4)
MKSNSMKRFLSYIIILLPFTLPAQTVSQKLQKAFQQFENDEQLKHAISSLYVIDAKTGQVVFDKNAQIGLAPASTQKIITSVTAFELLGKGYRYKTEFGSYSDLEKNMSLWIKSTGDPTFGSWRWEFCNSENIINTISSKLSQTNLSDYKGIVINGIGWKTERIPDGWIWQDIANYYGAGSGMLNWRENQYDLILRSGNEIGSKVSIVKTNPTLYSYNISSDAVSAAKGSGDNAYIYFPGYGTNAVVRGTIPINEDRFIISGSIVNPIEQFVGLLEAALNKQFKWQSSYVNVITDSVLRTPLPIYTHYSPSLDSIIYWFNKKSINLYGEALIKTFAYEKQGFGSTDSGVAIVKKFWKQKGLDEDELNIYDGSGLSPLNRVTTHAQVEILKYAKTKDWFPYFLKSLPDYNGMTMKSGTISDVKGFCGYHKAKDGKEYIFSFLVNNYSGKTSGLVGKMYKVLDELK